MLYLYPCDIVGNEDDGDGFAVTFPDVYGANTGGFTFRDSLILAEDCLVVALSCYVDLGKELPTPSPFQDGQELLTVQPVIAAQLDLYTAMREQGISQADLAERLGISSGAAEKLLSLDYCTPLSQVNQALLAVGGRPAAENQAA
jgi:antitoxin HicB